MSFQIITSACSQNWKNILMLLHKLVSLLLLPYFLKNSLQVYKHNHIYCCTDIIGVAIIIRAERKLQTRHGASTVREVILVNKEYDTPILPLKYSFNHLLHLWFCFFPSNIQVSSYASYTMGPFCYKWRSCYWEAYKNKSCHCWPQTQSCTI